MKQKLNLGFVTTYSGRWPKELPEQRDREYSAWLEENLPQVNVVKASRIGCTKEALEEIVREFKEKSVDVIVMVYGAFTGDDAAAYLTEMLNIPILLWAPYEVPFEKNTRLYANALCSMTMGGPPQIRSSLPYCIWKQGGSAGGFQGKGAGNGLPYRKGYAPHQFGPAGLPPHCIL